MNKQVIRDQFKAQRQALTDAQLYERSHLICQSAIQEIINREASYVHLFLPIEKNKEVDTRPLYDFLLEGDGYTPVISKTDWKGQQLTQHPMTSGDALEISNFGIPEPKHIQEIDIQLLDLVFIPLLAFDANGHRLGYGAGFYDRFLAQCPTALKLGLSLLPMCETALPNKPHDIALDGCITHEGLIDFRN